MSAKPLWKDGLFMMPQHFQLLDRYHEELLDQRVGSISPYLWGISDMEVDLDELARGIFRINRVNAIMPDGLFVQLGPENQAKGLTVMTAQGIRGGKNKAEIFLGVPSADVGGVSDGTVAGTRFVHQSEIVSDSYESSQETDIECVRPNAQLLMDEDNRQNYITIKLAELELDEAGRLAISQDYVPPCLRVSVSPMLTDRLARVVSAMASKQKSMVSKYGTRAAAMVEFGAADIATFWYLHTLNSTLPLMMHYADQGEVHPEQLYLTLATLAGQLSTFESRSDPVDIPRFRFDDLSGSLVPLFDLVTNLLGTVVSARYKVIQLEQTQPGLFVANLDDPQLLSAHDLYLVVGGDVPDNVLRDDVPRYVKLGSLDQIAQIVQSALPGIGAHVDLSPPSAVPVRAHMVYLQLGKTGRYWDAAQQSNSLAIYQPVKPDSVKLELLAVEG
jgi:type VI secretion system protein ImpJ